MTQFLDYLHDRLHGGGFSTEDALASLLPLMRQTVAAHRHSQVAPFHGVNDLHVEGVKIWFAESQVSSPKTNAGRLRELDTIKKTALEVTGSTQLTTDVNQAETSFVNLQIGKRGEEIRAPVYLPGYVCWEHEVGHHDPLTDIFSLGMILASMTCSLDFTQPEDLSAFVTHRRNLFHLNPTLHPVLAKAIVRMTELSRHRRPQDLGGLLHALENYRDQDIDLDFDLARTKELAVADRKGKRELILSRLQQRLYEISKRNRLLHFRQTLHTVNLTWGSVPLSFDVNSIQPEQILTWNAEFAATVASGKAVSLNKYLRFEESIYLPGLLDEIRNEARRDQAEFGFAQLRLVLCFLRWSNLKEKPPERFDSPLVLLPVTLAKTKGVRDVYTLEAQGQEAEVNPVLRHHLKQLYNVDIPEMIDLTADSSLQAFFDILAAKIQSSEPGITVEKIDRPRIQLIHAKARRRLDQYQRRTRLSGRGIRSFHDIDYSYDRDNFHPLGLRLIQVRVRTPESSLRPFVLDSPRPRTHAVPTDEDPLTPTPLPEGEGLGVRVSEKERMLYAKVEEEANPFRWEFDLCNLTLGNFRYRKMSLVRDYSAIAEKGTAHSGFDALFSLEPRPSMPTPPPTEIDESYAIVSCDPTQASAIALARAGQDFIIQGPPGTGKSQTITNLIADYVVRGKRVLFVCEKRAAIDVVFHRLQQTGLHQLSCLIHDSQADKKAFIMDMKENYERLLEGQDNVSSADQRRQKLIAAFQQELGPLRHFNNVMCQTPPQAGMPVRRLLHRALELQEHRSDLSDLEKERLPVYALWEQNRTVLDRLTGLLAENVGETVLSKHPLRHLSCRVAQEARPLEHVTQSLQSLTKVLDDVTVRLSAIPLAAADRDTPAKVKALIDYASKVKFLAEKDNLALLRPDSDASKALADLQKKHREKMNDLARIQKLNVNWRQKLSAEDVGTALEQARTFEKSSLNFLKLSWWRLRGVLRRSYNFAAHTVKPAWTRILESLEKEHKAAEGVAELDAKAREKLKFDGPFADFLERLTQARECVKQLSSVAQPLHTWALSAPGAGATLVQMIDLGPLLEQLHLEQARVIDGDLTFPQMREELVGISKSLHQLTDFLPCLAAIAKLPQPLTDAVRRLPLDLRQLEVALAAHSLELLFQADRNMAKFNTKVRSKHVAKLEEIHDELHEANAHSVLESIRRKFVQNVKTASLPHAQLSAEQKEHKVVYNRGRRELEHEFGKTMRYKSIRDLVAGDSGRVIQDLKPVWLMSPLSVSDTLPLDGEQFDVVVFDEASQVTLEEAIPAIFRAKQVIVVGDEMQLPPTNFFSAKGDDEETLEVEDEQGQRLEYDLGSSSFLNHAARTMPATMLGWHYRSRSESLISYSNAAFYQSKLLTVPDVSPPPPNPNEIRAVSAADGLAHVDALLNRPLSFHFMDRGIYRDRRNSMEAAYIAHLTKGLLSRDDKLSIGIVAFSEAQQSEIERALRDLAADDAEFQAKLEAEWEREDDGQFVGLLVKNLENIQGDERDVVIISVCYGNNPAGKMLMNFGPINQTGGEKRLNVAFSRAKHHLALVSSIRHAAITNDYNDGARCLKNYIRYAEAMSQGDLSSARRVLCEMSPQETSDLTNESVDLVISELAAALTERGYQVDRAIGQSHFRCDLAVRRSGDHAYRTGILVDTDEYYRHVNLLERDVLRPKLLRAFGWNLAHVLTKDWYQDRAGVIDQVATLVKRGS